MRHQKLVRGCLACVYLLAGWLPPTDAAAISPRVRPISTALVDALERGRRDSPTLAALLDALERSDVIVHVESRWFPRTLVIARTKFITWAGRQRYIRISIDARMQGDGAIALLGHELQHAWEIAQASWVRDEQGLVQLYRQIGYYAGGGSPAFIRLDTDAGPDVERQVRLELRAARGRRGPEGVTGGGLTPPPGAAAD